jgi:nucleotide-binding universal stress UspA family protein
MVIRAVLCPVDFSEASKAALGAAVRVVRQFKAHLHVLFVEDPLLAAAAGRTDPPLADLKSELKEFIASTRDLELPGELTLHVVTGQPAEEIVRFAEHECMDTIVMGAHGLTGVRKAFFGSTTARVLKRATIPLLVVPASAGADKGQDLAGLGSILVLTDFSAAAAFAAEAAASLAALVGARLVLVHVMPRVPAPASWTSRAAAATECCATKAHQQMCVAMAPLETYGPVESVIVEGNIPESVAELARTHHSGLIVLGLDAEAGGSRPGSTAYGLISTTPVPVLVVPAVVRALRQDAAQPRVAEISPHDPETSAQAAPAAPEK